MKEKRTRRLRRVLAVLLALVMVYLGVRFCYGPLRYRAFYRAADSVGVYQDMKEGFVPQGMTQDEAGGAYLVCGYMQGDQPSRIYVYLPDGEVRRIFLQNTDGSPYEGHAGGMTVSGDYVYISNAHKLFQLKTADVLAAKDGDTLQFGSAFEVPCNASFCSSDGQNVYVGEYHAKGYETDETHAVDFDGEAFAALVFAYPLSFDGDLLPGAAPERVFVIPDAVQGFAADGNRAFLSRSAGFSPSALETYTLDGEPDGSFAFEGKALPRYVLGKARLTASLPAPHMSEDLDVRNGVLLCGFEAGAKKFGRGLLPATEKSFMKVDIRF